MPKEKTTDELIEEEQARVKRVRRKVQPFTNRPLVEHDEIPEKEPEKETETPLVDFIDDWKVGVKIIGRKIRGR